MLRSMKELYGYTIRATDGDIGKVYEFYFDDEVWTIQYLMADIGSWISGRSVLISRAVLQASPSPDLMAHILPVELTKEQVENSRDVDTVMPVYRQRMGDLSRDWPLYWGGGRLLVAGIIGAYDR